MPAAPTVRVVIVSYETRDELRRCLRTLEPGHRAGLEVVVVDNASGDGSAAMVREEFPGVRLEASAVNLGFAGGINRGLAGSDTDYVLVLNPDVELPPSVLARLVAFMESRQEAAAVSPLLIGDDGVPQEHLYRRFPSTLQLLLFWTVLSVVAGRIDRLRKRFLEHRLEGDRPVGVDQLPGAALLMRGADLERIGPWDPDYFIWWEDVDWCYRARRAGRELFVLPDAKARHAGAASFGSWTIQTRVLQFYRAFFRFLCKHRLDGLRRRAAPLLLADLHLKGVILAVRRRMGLPHPEAVGSLRPARTAIRDVVARCERGQLPAFRGVGPDLPGDAGSRDGGAGDSGADGAAGVDVVIVAWNGRRYLPECLRALRASSVRPRIIVVDNASTDGTREWLADTHPDVTLVALNRNAGYAGGANAGIRESRGRYVMVMNPDVRLAPDHLERLAARLDEDSAIGAAQGRLWRIGEDAFVEGRTPDEPTLDSAGHRLRRSRMAYDRGQGERGPPWDREVSVFSASGAAVLLRRSMLRDIAPGGEPFDPTFFAYKEDVDLGWRARLFGWDVRYVPDAEAWHVRAVPGPGRQGRGAPAGARRHSWMNHWLMMIKNDRARDLVRDLPWIAGWELVRLGHALLRDPALLPAYVGIWSRVPAALRQRRFIQAARRVPGADIRRWLTRDALPPGSGGEAVEPRAALEPEHRR